MKKLIIVLVVAILVGFGIRQYLNRSNQIAVSPSPTETPTPTETATPSATPEEANSIVAPDMQKPGSTVTVDAVMLAKAGYVVVTSDSNGKPSSGIGHSKLLPAGMSQKVTVTVSPALVKNKYYWAVLRVDNGDSVYKASDDLAAKNSKGDAVVVRFLASNATPSPSVSATPGASASPSSSATVTPTPSTATNTKNVSIVDFAFAPSNLTVKKGDKIVFTNNDSVTHTVTADGGAWDSGNLANGKSYTLDTTKLAVGTYAYHCTLHPSMKGTLVVQ